MRATELPRTFRATVRCFSGMHSHMPDETVPLRETAAANVALVRSDTFVYPHVDLEARLCSEAPLAEFAFERLFARMGLQVAVQVGRVREALAATWTRQVFLTVIVGLLVSR